jgi:hypothetical protein
MDLFAGIDDPQAFMDEVRRVLKKAKYRAANHNPLAMLSPGMREFEMQLAREEEAAIDALLAKMPKREP